jgi:4'-phosphopantetheinyl transferase
MHALDSWPLLESAPQLEPGEIHIWRIKVPDEHELPHYWTNLLTQEERERVNRKRLPIDSRRTLASRACLRTLLGGYLHLKPQDIKLKTKSEGKPFVEHQGTTSRIEFNVSHSGEWILMGFSLDRSLGIDVEQRRELVFGDLVNDFFAPSEQKQWNALNPDQHSMAFFSAWTRKEAYLKAIGLGLTKALNSFAVSLNDKSPSQIDWCSDNPTTCRHWQIVDLEPAPDYKGALVAESLATYLRKYTFNYL